MICIILSVNMLLTDFVAYASSFGDNGNMIESADDTNADITYDSALSDLNISGDGSLGGLINKEISDEVGEIQESNGYKIISVSIEDVIATVEYETLDDAELIVSIYDNEGKTFIASGRTIVSAEEIETKVEINIETMPEFFFIRAYLIEQNTLKPLSDEYECNLYTQSMVEFLMKTPEDYEKENVLVLEEESNNYLVYNDETRVIPYNESYNNIEVIDDVNKKYVISNPDDEFLSVTPGEIISYEFEDGKVLIVNVESVSFADEKLTITGSDVEIEEVFEYVHIDSDFDMSEYEIDNSNLEEDVVVAEDATEVPLNNSSVGSGIEVTIEPETYFIGKKDKNGDVKGFYGSVAFTAKGSFKLIKNGTDSYIELKVGFSLDVELGFQNEIEKTKKLGYVTIPVCPGVNISFTPKLVFRAEGKLTLNAHIELDTGVRVDFNGSKNISKKPITRLGVALDGKVFFGVSFTPAIELAGGMLCEIELTAEVGVELDGEMCKTEHVNYRKHSCVNCMKGEIKGIIDISGSVELFGLDWFKFGVNFVEVEIDLGECYYSTDHLKFGLGECPYVTYKVLASVVDQNYKGISGVSLYGKSTTDANGNATLWLKKGKYSDNLKVSGYTTSNVSWSGSKKLETGDEYVQRWYFVLKQNVQPKNIAINYTNFPDVKFRNYVKANYDSNGNGYLSNSELDGVDRIDISGKSISSIKGIEHFSNLNILICSNNNISSVDLSKNKNLVSVNFNYNKLTTLNLSNFSLLGGVECYNNNLTSINVSNSPKLYHLFCGHNKLKSIDVTGNTSLGMLDCRDNQLTSLNVTKNTNLSDLNCQDNNLTTLNVNNNTKLTDLWCCNNKLTSLNLKNNTKLKRLNCSDNLIKSLNLSNNTLLESAYYDSSVSVTGYNGNATLNGASGLINDYEIGLNGTTNSDELSTNTANPIEYVATETDATESISGLYENEKYNLYLVKESNDSYSFGDALEPTNILYMKQYMSDSSGNLNVEYYPCETYESAVLILQCARRLDIALLATVSVDDYVYDGDEKVQLVDVSVGNEKLRYGIDYELGGDVKATEVGEYTVVVNGLGKYEGQITATYKITEPIVYVEKINMDNKMEITVGDVKTIDSTITPDTSTDKTIIWSSSDESVAIVDENGKVTALKVGKTTITALAADGSGVTSSCELTVSDIPKTYYPIDVSYRTHIQSFGWEGDASDITTWKSNGTMSGTSGKAKRLEGINIVVNSAEVGKNVDLGIQYTTHCQSYGWLPWSADGDMNGTEGEAKRLEAIKIQLTGADKDAYDVYYRVHAQSYGWLNWAKNGAPSGTAGYGKRLEGIQIVVVKKGESFNQKMEGITSVRTESYIAKEGSSPIVNYAPTSNTNPVIPGADTPNVAYRTHVQSFGWQGWKYNGQMSGTSGLAKRLEGININLTNKPCDGDIVYTTHVQTYGWKDGKPEDTTRASWKKNGEMSGTSGEAKRLEAICIDLTGEMGEKYDIYYRVHAQSFGWLGWACNGEESGTAGYAKRLEGIQIVLVPKGGVAPANDFGGVTSVRTEGYIEK